MRFAPFFGRWFSSERPEARRTIDQERSRGLRANNEQLTRRPLAEAHLALGRVDGRESHCSPGEISSSRSLTNSQELPESYTGGPRPLGNRVLESEFSESEFSETSTQRVL